MDLALREDGEEVALDSARPSDQIESVPAVGQVRLLFPGVAGYPVRLRYLAILRETYPGQFLAAPFSRFSVPANPGEWRTSRAELPLRVLCLWNACRWKAEALAASWLVDSFAAEELAQALEVFEAFRDRSPPKKEWSGSVGPPLYHPLDPRHEYMEEEREWIERLFLTGRPRASREWVFPDHEGTRLPLAAERPGKYRPSRRNKKRRN